MERVRAAGGVVWVLPSDTSWAYTEAIAALQDAWRQGAGGMELVILKPQDLPAESPPTAVVTLGGAALRWVRERAASQASWARVPLICALLPRDGFTAIWKRPPSTVSAAYLDQSVHRYLMLVRLAMPRLNKVGVLLHEDAMEQREVLIREAQQHGVKLAIGVVSTPGSLSAALREVMAEVDVLLILPDSRVADPSAVQHMLMTAYRQRIPVLAYSPALVKAGAALGLYASPAQVGRQVAGMLRTGLGAGGTSAVVDWPASRSADAFTVAVNEQVCRSLGLDVPSVATLTDALQREENKR